MSLNAMYLAVFSAILKKKRHEKGRIWKRNCRSVSNAYNEDTKEWEEAKPKANDTREELRVKFKSRKSYEELRNQLE